MSQDEQTIKNKQGFTPDDPEYYLTEEGLLRKEFYGEGDGSSEEEAIKVNATDSFLGVAVESKLLEERFGKSGADWKAEIKMLTSNAAGQHFDKIIIRLNDGTERTIFFDISSFFGIRSKIRSKDH